MCSLFSFPGGGDGEQCDVPILFYCGFSSQCTRLEAFGKRFSNGKNKKSYMFTKTC